MHGTINAARGLALAFTLALASVGSMQAQQASPVGDWSGEVSGGGPGIPLILHVTEADDGSLAATLDSPTQGAFGIPAGSASFDEGTLTVSFPNIPGEPGYEGTMSEDGSTLEGDWSQGGGSVALSLVREDASADR